MNRNESAALDRHITGNYGEDFFAGHEPVNSGTRCECGQVIWITDGATECGGEGEGGCCILYGDEPEQAADCAALGCGPHSAEAVARAQALHEAVYEASLAG